MKLLTPVLPVNPSELPKPPAPLTRAAVRAAKTPSTDIPPRAPRSKRG